jgi:hypothetical protein
VILRNKIFMKEEDEDGGERERHHKDLGEYGEDEYDDDELEGNEIGAKKIVDK